MSEDKGTTGVVELRRDYPDAPSEGEVVRRNVAAVRSAVFGMTEARRRGLRAERKQEGVSSGEPKGKEVDPFRRLAHQGKIVEPPFDMLTFAMLPEQNTELGPAVDAMVVNVESFGWKVEPRVPVDESTPLDLVRTLAEERTVAENFYPYCYRDGSFEDLRERVRKDLEYTGNAYVEFVEAPGDGELQGLHHLPSWTMRLSVLDREATAYEELRVQKRVRVVEEPDESDPEELVGEPPEGMDRVAKRHREDVGYELVRVTRMKRFRRYVQRVGSSAVWFKELNDPRLIDSRTGSPVTDDDLAEVHGPDAPSVPRYTTFRGQRVVRTGRTGFPVAQAANPVRHLSFYSARSPYGLPRHVGHLFCIFGSRAKDEINYTTFKNNNVPNLAITVSNGNLTDGSVERVQEFIEAAIQSDDNYSKILLLEADPSSDGIRDPGTVKIDIKPLTKEQHTDALFVEYGKDNDDRVRRAWRYSPIFVGILAGVSGKEIEAGRKLSDEQVFTPERHRIDRFQTRDVLPRLGIVWSTFRSLSPNVTENAELVRLLVSAEKSGGITPRISRQIMSLVTNRDLGEIDPGKMDPDKPFSLSLAELMMDRSSTQDGSGPTSQGRTGVRSPSPPRDRSTEPAGSVQNLARMLREECDRRFGGFVPPALEEVELGDDDEV